KRVEDFLSTLDTSHGINVIDIGCGNAYPVFPILSYLAGNGIEFTYVPMDISAEMLTLATDNVSQKFPGTQIKSIKADFELGQFSEAMYELKQHRPINLLLFLGSTLGNHSDLNRVLTNFRDSMTSKDYLILGVEMTNLAKARNLLPHYENEGVETLVTYSLGYLPLPKSAYTYKPSWNEKLSQIEMRADLLEDVHVDFAGEKFVLRKGESLLLGRSIKFSE